jgi:hypothetical protein
MVADDKKQTAAGWHGWKNPRAGGKGMGAVYSLGLIGALVYYFHQATTFWMVVTGLFKAVFWPAFIVYHWLQFLHM